MSGVLSAPVAEPGALWQLFCAEARRVAGPESRSMPTARAEALLRSLLFTLAESPEQGPDLARRLRRGRESLLARRGAAKAAWERLFLARPAVRNVYLDDTLRAFAPFFRRYDVYDAADAVPAGLDYPLLAPLPEGLCGVALAEEYLRRLEAEFRFLRRWTPAACRALYAAFLPGWRGLCFNLCEPVFANALAQAALGTAGETLLLRPEQAAALEARLAAEGEGLLRSAFDSLRLPEGDRACFRPAAESIAARLRAGSASRGVFTVGE